MTVLLVLVLCAARQSAFRGPKLPESLGASLDWRAAQGTNEMHGTYIKEGLGLSFDEAVAKGSDILSKAGPALQAAGRAMQRAFGKRSVFVREGGSIPVIATFDKLLRVPSVLMGVGLNDDNLHAPNEKIELDNFYRGIEASAYLMEELGNPASKTPSRSARSRPRKKK